MKGYVLGDIVIVKPEGLASETDSHDSNDVVAAAPPRGACAMDLDYWVGVVVEKYTQVKGRVVKTVHNTPLNPGDEYIVLQWYEAIQALDDGGRLYKAEDEPLFVLWEQTLIVPMKKKLKKIVNNSAAYAISSQENNLILATMANISS